MKLRALVVLLVLTLAGALAGTLGDQIHTQFHVLSYPHGVSWLFGQAVWVPLLFAGAVPALIYGHGISARLAGGNEARPRRVDVWKPALWHFGAYFSTGLFFTTPRLLTLGLILLWLARVALATPPRRGFVLHSLSCGILGPAFEMALSSTGAFVYARPDWVIPMWLPALYLNAAPLARHIYLAWVVAPPEREAATPA